MKKSVSPIVFLDIENTWEKIYLKNGLSREKGLVFLKTAEAIGKNTKDAEIVSIFIESRVNSDFLRHFPKLRFIATRSTGFDHIDLGACRKRDIAVSNVPVYGENTVAEHTFALILSLSRNLRKAYLRTMQNDFSLKGLMGFDLKGKTLGVVGTGHIGLHVIRMAIGFGMKVVAYDVKENKFLSEVLGFEYCALDELLSRSDIISLHLPFMPSTKHMINKDSIKKIKKGAILINTARGGLIDTDALIAALDKGVLRGAGLDVLEEEEYLREEKRLVEAESKAEHWERLQASLKNNTLLHRENVIYTPHMAFYSKEAVQRILDTTVENIRGFIGGSPVNRLPGRQ